VEGGAGTPVSDRHEGRRSRRNATWHELATGVVASVLVPADPFRSCDQFGWFYSQSLAEPCKSFHRWRLLAQFQKADVIAGQPGTKSQLFLGHPCGRTSFADFVAEHNSNATG
jgi:hypothetical protein